ncbi:glycosyltransferase family 2 protein [Sphingobacterium sp. UDSM-2020]|uniref:glycosyltransferase family 2 protein n=1 Tax=Sphingobacterium sp. UDSM-2020 TaxID=2795738 RepID=UPI0019363870|nr:glycosyltransferase family 2 protein [Sphingobacterium sp. UDSM-2020]QQD13382.1 glycosyltransferase [Sphingobacterium sp. UDSM-2020]
MKSLKINIITPCYNEVQNIKIFYMELMTWIASYDYTVTFVNDGSDDDTQSEILRLSIIDNRVDYIRLSRNFGHQAAIKAGLDVVAECDFVIIMDVDLQHPPKYIPIMIDKWKNGADVVNAIRINDPSNFIKKNFSIIFYNLINKISDVKIIPNSPDFRLISYNVLTSLRQMNEQAYFLRFILPWIGYNHHNILFECPSRKIGSSKYTLKKQVSLFLRGVTSTTINPLRFSMLFGLFFSTLSFTYAGYAIYQYLFNNKTLIGWTSIVFSVLFIAGIQFLLIGLIGEYLGKTFSESKKRPHYIVNSKKISD